MRETWGVYSVKDHLNPNAFVADVLLYDRLVVPVPPSDDEGERARWTEQGWAPERLEGLLTILGERAHPVPWNAERRDEWQTRWAARDELAQQSPDDGAYLLTGTQLRDELQVALPHVEGVVAVASYASKDAFDRDVELRPAAQLPEGELAAVLGWEFLVPADEGRTHDDRLRSAVELSSDDRFGEHRQALWQWQRDFVRDGVTTPASVDAAVEKMHSMLDAQRAAARKTHVQLASSFAFAVAAVGAGALAGPLALGTGMIVTIGKWAIDKWPTTDEGASRPWALFYDTRKHFDWR